jgi:hypothetical protein
MHGLPSPLHKKDPRPKINMPRGSSTVGLRHCLNTPH